MSLCQGSRSPGDARVNLTRSRFVEPRGGQYAEAQADGLGRLASLTTQLSGTGQDNLASLGYNPTSQIASRTRPPGTKTPPPRASCSPTSAAPIVAILWQTLPIAFR
jgi:hypothetical protein